MSIVRPGTGSTVRRMLVGAQLRRLRENKNISREEAGYTIRASESKISRLELGRVSFKARDVNDLLLFYGINSPDEREAIVRLAEEANEPGWWHDFNDLLPGWFETYVGLEEAAQLIRTYEVQFIPGLLQTEAYARAVNTLGHGDAKSEEIDRRVQLRLERQNRLEAPDGPRLWAVVDEAALWRPIGGAEVMRGQLEHLTAVAKQPGITLQVMPFKFGGHSAEGGAFTILRYAESELPDIVYVEQLTSAHYMDKRTDVDPYMVAMERLCIDAATPDDSIEIINHVREQT